MKNNIMIQSISYLFLLKRLLYLQMDLLDLLKTKLFFKCISCELLSHSSLLSIYNHLKVKVENIQIKFQKFFYDYKCGIIYYKSVIHRSYFHPKMSDASNCNTSKDAPKSCSLLPSSDMSVDGIL
jgi:hypothetical protein